MTKYRIVKIENYYGRTYHVQKKSWWFPFWHSWTSIQSGFTGFLSNEEEARRAIEEDRFKSKKQIINV